MFHVGLMAPAPKSMGKPQQAAAGPGFRKGARGVGNAAAVWLQRICPWF